MEQKSAFIFFCANVPHSPLHFVLRIFANDLDIVDFKGILSSTDISSDESNQQRKARSFLCRRPLSVFVSTKTVGFRMTCTVTMQVFETYASTRRLNSAQCTGVRVHYTYTESTNSPPLKHKDIPCY